MNDQELISMLNRDLADEHAAIIRYLVHAYLEGEDTPLGAGLLSRSREEMWHMHWLGMIIGRLGGEPEMKPAPYPHDPTNRATLFESYVRYEEKLIPHYMGEAEKTADPHIKRVLQREAWESEMHAVKFKKVLSKLTPEQANQLPEEENELPTAFVEAVQQAVSAKYNQMLQCIRDSWVFQKDAMLGWQIMDFSMTKMKQLAHLAEPVAENGFEPRFDVKQIRFSSAVGTALRHTLESLADTRKQHSDLLAAEETQKHAGLITNLELSIKQETYESDEISDRL
ncbi:MAG: ferritin-like domain-containing protein [Desulfobacterales bacterium]